jgi:hypothetical protein
VARNVRQVFSALVLAGLAGLLVVPPAAAGEPAGEPEQEPTSLDLQLQQAQLARLRAEAERRAASVDDAQQALAGAVVLAGQALESYATAVQTLHTQQQRERQRQSELTQAQLDVDNSRRELSQWAQQAYSTGSGLGGSVTLATLLLSDGPQDVGTTLTALHRIGRHRDRALTGMRVARKRADVAADAAATASEAAAAAAVEASAAKQASEQAVNTQRRLLGLAESWLAQSDQEIAEASARAAGLRAALLDQGSLSPLPVAGLQANPDNRVTGQVGACTGAAVEQYANGQIPLAALCPLRAAAGHHLRADAAYAFDRMGQAYAGRFGSTICITDSYRSYAAQVSVYARKPGLAAIPGTSNHGWGRAVDLCGGIQSFSSAQHRWMRENAALYGWFHPGWAQQNGSKPEPWHWEYGG